MKTWLTTTGLALVIAVFGVGCAKEKAADPVYTAVGTNIPQSPGGPLDPSRSGDTGRTSDFAEGATAPFVAQSISTMTKYVKVHPVNSPEDLQISVKLEDVGSGKFAGVVQISYYDNGQYYTGKFYADDRVVGDGLSHGHDGKHYAEYNRWFTWGGDEVFHGFFEDQLGAIMLIVNESVDEGDGSGFSKVNGEIWYRNFQTTTALHGVIPCWFIEAGPYECRTFLTNEETLSTTSALYPNQSLYYTQDNVNVPKVVGSGWSKLGEFTGLDKEKAFGL
jgi:hypothetical protein